MSTALVFAVALIVLAWLLAFLGDTLTRRTMRPCRRRALLRTGWWLLTLVCSASLWVLVAAYADRWVRP